MQIRYDALKRQIQTICSHTARGVGLFSTKTSSGSALAPEYRHCTIERLVSCLCEVMSTFINVPQRTADTDVWTRAFINTYTELALELLNGA